MFASNMVAYVHHLARQLKYIDNKLMIKTINRALAWCAIIGFLTLFGIFIYAQTQGIEQGPTECGRAGYLQQATASAKCK